MNSLEEMGKRAAEVKYRLQVLSTEEKNQALLLAAEGLVADREAILAANEADMDAGRAAGMHMGLLDRLRLDADRIDAMAQGLRQVTLSLIHI